MSVTWITRVWKRSPYSGTQLLIHLAFADFANDNGDFFAAQGTIAEKARCSVEYVRQTVTKMASDGLLEVGEKGKFRGKATEYRLLPPPNTVGQSLPKAVGESETVELPNSLGVELPNTVTPQLSPNSPTLPGELPNSDGSLPKSAWGQPSYATNYQPKEVGGEVAQTLIAEWVEHCKQRPPKNVIGQIAKQITSLINDSYSEDQIRTGLIAWHHKGLHPSTLPSVVHEVINTPQLRKQSTTDQRIAENAERFEGRFDDNGMLIKAVTS